MADQDLRHATETCLNNLQEATLLVGYLKRTRDADVADLVKLHGALQRAVAALRDLRREKGGA